MYLGNIANAPPTGISHLPQTGMDISAVKPAGNNPTQFLFPLSVTVATPPTELSKWELTKETRRLAAEQKSGFPLAATKDFPGARPNDRCLMATRQGVAYQNAAEWKAGRGGLYIPANDSGDIICADPLQEETLLREIITQMRDKASFSAGVATEAPAAAAAVTAPKNVADMPLEELEKETRVLSRLKWENFPDAAQTRPVCGQRSLMATRSGMAYQTRREWREGTGLYIPHDSAKDIQCSAPEKKRRLLERTLEILRATGNTELPDPKQQKLEDTADTLIKKISVKRERLYGAAISTPDLRHLPLSIGVIKTGGMFVKMGKSLNRIDEFHPKTEKRFIDLGKSIVAAAVMPSLELGPRQHFKVVPNQFIEADERGLVDELNYTTIFTASEALEGTVIMPYDVAPPELSNALKTAGFLLQFNDLFSKQGNRLKLHNVVVAPEGGNMKAFDYFSDSPNIMQKPADASIQETLGKSRAEISRLIDSGETRAKRFFATYDESLRTDTQYEQKSAAVMAGIDEYITSCRNNLAQLND
jgi:hypothetical protein